MRASPWLMLYVTAVALCGCLDDPDDGVGRRCDLSVNGNDLEGRWTLHASGQRLDCDDRRLEGDLTLQTSMPVRVSAQAQATTNAPTADEAEFEADAFVDRIERADFLIEGEDPEGDGVRVRGSATGSCFLVHIEEELPDGDTLRYDLDGYITSRGTARGDFTGRGPEDCRTEGTFRLQID